MFTKFLKASDYIRFTSIFLTSLLFVFAFAACVKESDAPDKRNQTTLTAASPSQAPTEQQIKLVEAMSKRANSGTTISAIRDVLTTTKMNNQDKAAIIYHLLTLGNNDSYRTLLKNVDFKQMKFIRRFEGRTQVNNYQIDFSKPMTEDVIEYIK